MTLMPWLMIIDQKEIDYSWLHFTMWSGNRRWHSVDNQLMCRGLEVTWIYPPTFPTTACVFVFLRSFFFFFPSPLSLSSCLLSLYFPVLTPASLSFLFRSPLLSSLLSPLMWKPDEALIVSTGSQHLPHLKQKGRSLMLSVPPKAFLSFPLCSSPLPPSPTASSAESPQRSIVYPYEPC